MKEHIIRQGDTLSALARHYGTTVATLTQANNLQDASRIRVGQKLLIPEAASPGAPAPTSAPAQPKAGPTAGEPSAKALSMEQLRAIMPKLTEARARELLPHLAAALQEAEIHTPLRQAAFLAQLGHESGDLRYFEELASGEAYEGRKDLGNTQPGDGPRFKGRGPIQLTGRNNYRVAGKALGVDLENNPTRAADPDVGFRTAAWFWNSRKLNTSADTRDFDTITKKINGGFNGKEDRDARYQRALKALGAATT
jgi:putative chitinase